MMFFIALQFENRYNLLQLFYNFCRNKHGKGRNSMKYQRLKKPSKIRLFGSRRHGIKAYKTAFSQIPTMKTLGSSDNSRKAAPAAASAPAAENVKAAVEIDFSNVKIEPLFEEMVDFETFSKSDYRAVKIKDCVAVPKSKKLLQFTLDDGSGTDRTILSGIHEYYEPEDLIGKTAIAIVNLPPRKMMGIDSCGMLISAVHEEDGHEGLNLLMVDDRIPAGAKLY